MNAFVENIAGFHTYRKSVMPRQFDGLTLKATSRIFASSMADASNLIAHIDGGSLGNPGPSGIGVVIDGSAGGTVRIKKWIGHQDNNVAEYVALLEVLQFAVHSGAMSLHVFSDSELVVKQMTGVYTCRSPRLYSLHWTCQKLARSLEFSITHIPREENVEANRLANSAVRKRRS